MWPTFKVDLFREDGLSKRQASRIAMLQMLEALIWCDILHLQEHPDTPKLYQKDIQGIPGFRNFQYIPEIDTEEWLDFPQSIREGGGDCEDLACMLIAEYHMQGINALPRIRWRRLPTKAEIAAIKNGAVIDPEDYTGSWRFHCLVTVLGRPINTWQDPKSHPYMPARLDPSAIYANPPTVEDPSVVLGMGKYAKYLSGNYDPKAAEEGLLNEARRSYNEGNIRAAKTLILRANTLRDKIE